MKSEIKHSSVNQRFNQAGFSLVELMVGVTIGLLATLAIMQVMGSFEAQKRITTGTADAQTNGNIALYNLSHDIQSAGYGLMFSGKHTDKTSAIDCTSLSATGLAGVGDLAPVTIVDGGATGSDNLIIRSALTNLAGLPTRIISAPVGNTITVASNLGCKNGDFLLINNAGACAMTRLDATNGVTGDTRVGLDASGTPPAVAVENAVLSCLAAWRINTYAVSGGNLQLNAGDAVADIVNMQAQYGVSDSVNSNKITSWQTATGTYDTTMTVANRNLIKAVRLAVVSRNSKMEASDVTASCSFTTDGGLAIDLSGDANCKRYRYSVYEAVVPLRNMIWSKD